MQRMRSLRGFQFSLIAIGALMIPDAQAQVPLYEMVDLGTLGGPSAGAQDINSAGHIVGDADDVQLTRKACFWRTPSGQRPEITELESLVTSRTSAAWAINDQFQIVGYAHDSSFHSRATLWQHGQAYDLGTLGGPESIAFDINANGVIVGYSETSSSGTITAFVIAPTMQPLPGLAGPTSVAWAINDSDVIVGSTFLPAGGGERAVRWRQSPTQEGWQVFDLTIVPNRNSAARSINGNGDIVGWAEQEGSAGSQPSHATLWRSDALDQPYTPTDLGVLPGMFTSRALHLNDSLEVVGSASGLGPEIDRAFYWTPTLGLHDLNDLIVNRGSRVMMSANAIGEDGRIVGYGVDGARPRAFLLNPIP